MLANSERLSAWLPPCTMPTRKASSKKSQRRRHAVAEDADQRVDGERDEDRPLGADPARERAEEEGEGDADELDQEDRGDQR